MSKTPWICNAAWNSITFYPNGKIAPCCQYHVDHFKPLADFNGTETFKDIQEQMMEGEIPPGCIRCQQREEKKQFSYRTHYGTEPDRRHHFKHIDLRNSNFCNLACRFCGPEASSTWAKRLDVGFITDVSVFEYVDSMLTEHVEEVYITGGEPFLNPDHWTMLEKIIERGLAKNIHLRYNTNLTTLTYKGRNVLDYWPEFKKVSLSVSIEAVGRPLEMIRSGAKWHVIEQNLDQLKAVSKNVSIEIFCTVSSLNVWFLPELVEYLKLRKLPIQFLELTEPDLMSIVNLPVEFRTQAVDILKSLDTNSSEIKNMIGYINLNDPFHILERLVMHILMLDNLNKENLFDLMPFKDYALKKLTPISYAGY
jgi:sulfatase maturation enzyme AslB (radical SAM superfamily)